MAGAAKPKSPDWIRDSLKHLLLHYRDAMKLEYVYEEYFAKEELYNERYKDHIAEVTARKYKDDQGGGIIDTFELAISAIGEVEFENGKHVAGSNWLPTQTSWRKFGLLTGYNMQFQKETVLDMHLVDREGKRLTPGEYNTQIWDNVFKWDSLWHILERKDDIQNYQEEAGEHRNKMSRTLSAHYFTGVPGLAEPGAGAESFMAESGRKQESGFMAMFLGQNDPGEGEQKTRGLLRPPLPDSAARFPAGHDRAGETINDPNSIRSFGPLHGYGQRGAGHVAEIVEQIWKTSVKPWGATAFRKDTPTSQPMYHPMYPATGMMARAFYTDEGAKSEIYGPALGHFLSPQLAYYYKVDKGKAGIVGEIDYDYFVKARGALQAAGAALVDPIMSQGDFAAITLNEHSWGKSDVDVDGVAATNGYVSYYRRIHPDQDGWTSADAEACAIEGDMDACARLAAANPNFDTAQDVRDVVLEGVRNMEHEGRIRDYRRLSHRAGVNKDTVAIASPTGPTQLPRSTAVKIAKGTTAWDARMAAQGIGVVNVPDRVSIYPTLPLESLTTIIGTSGWGSCSPVKQDGTPWYTENEAIKAEWLRLYDDFVAGTGPIAALGKAIEESIIANDDLLKKDKRYLISNEDPESKDVLKARKDLTKEELEYREAMLTASGTDHVDAGHFETIDEARAGALQEDTVMAGKNKWEQALVKEIERILDFYGAGLLDNPTGAQARGLAALGGLTGTGKKAAARPDLAHLTPDAQKVITGYRSLTPFDLQCFLVENIRRVTQHKDAEDKIYGNLIKLRGDPGATISQLKHGNRTDAIREILNLTPAVYGVLVPYIKIYRVDYAESDKAGLKPLIQREMPIPNFMDPGDIEQITKGEYTRPSGWGLESFTWKLDGVQPAEVDNNISANLTFYFQSVRDLFESSRAYDVITKKINYSAGKQQPAPLDLLISAATMQQVLDQKNKKNEAKKAEKKPVTPKSCANFDASEHYNDKYDGHTFRIKVVAGWATPPRAALRAALPDKTSADLERLEEALSATRIGLYLQQVRHDINFNQDGSVKLSIDYQAALTGILTSNKLDVLGPSTQKHVDELEKLNADLKASKTAHGERTAEIKDQKGTAAKDQLKKESSAHKKKLKKLLERKKELINEDKVKKYKRFLKGLYRPSVTSPTTGRQEQAAESGGSAAAMNSTRIYTMVIDQAEAVKTPLHKMTDAKLRRERITKRKSNDPGFDLMSGIGSAGSNVNFLGAVNRTLDMKELSKSTKALAGAMADDYRANLMSRGDVIMISYFYLGDLIDSIIEDNAAIGNKGELAKMIKNPYITFLADVEVTDPLRLYWADNIEETLCGDTAEEEELISQLRAKGSIPPAGEGTKIRINIGSIPIALDQFNIWFKNHVIKSQRNSYYLMHFLKDLCAYLIGPALKQACFESNIVNEIRFDTSIVHFHNKKSKSQLKIHPNTLKQYTVHDLAQAIGETTPNNDIPSPGMSKEQRDKMDMTTGLVLYSTDARPKNRHGDLEEDLKDGIYHHYLGSSAGLVKKINFRRTDQAYLREAKIQRYGHLGAQQLRELYSATIDMVGNTLFKNGQYTYIWPTSMVAGQDDMAKLLGLGGYFLITGVSHKISPSGYDVSVTALQEGMTFSEQEAPVNAKTKADAHDPEKKDGVATDAADKQDAQDQVAEGDQSGAGTNPDAEQPSADEAAAADSAAAPAASGYTREGREERRARRAERKKAREEAAKEAEAETSAEEDPPSTLEILQERHPPPASTSQ